MRTHEARSRLYVRNRPFMTPLEVALYSLADRIAETARSVGDLAALRTAGAWREEVINSALVRRYEHEDAQLAMRQAA